MPRMGGAWPSDFFGRVQLSALRDQEGNQTERQFQGMNWALPQTETSCSPSEGLGEQLMPS